MTMTEEKDTPQAPSFETAYPGADELMKSIMDDYDDGSAPVAAPAEPSEEEQPEPAVAQGEGEGGDESDEETPVAEDATQPGVAGADKARKAAKLAGLPASVVEKASDEELVEWYSAHAKNEADVKRAFRERADLQRELDELRATTEAEPAVPTATEDSELTAALDEMLGVGAEDAKKLAAILERRLDQPNERVRALEAQLEQKVAQSAWGDVAKRLGIDSDAGGEVPEDVMAMAQALSTNKTGPWAGLKGEARVQALFMAAARATNPNAPSDAELQRRAAISRAKKNGPGTAAPQRKAPEKKLTQDEILDAKIEAIRNGETDVQKLRAIGR